MKFRDIKTNSEMSYYAKKKKNNKTFKGLNWFKSILYRINIISRKWKRAIVYNYNLILNTDIIICDAAQTPTIQIFSQPRALYILLLHDRVTMYLRLKQTTIPFLSNLFPSLFRQISNRTLFVSFSTHVSMHACAIWKICSKQYFYSFIMNYWNLQSQ